MPSVTRIVWFVDAFCIVPMRGHGHFAKQNLRSYSFRILVVDEEIISCRLLHSRHIYYSIFQTRCNSDLISFLFFSCSFLSTHIYLYLRVHGYNSVFPSYSSVPLKILLVACGVVASLLHPIRFQRKYGTILTWISLPLQKCDISSSEILCFAGIKAKGQT